MGYPLHNHSVRRLQGRVSKQHHQVATRGAIAAALRNATTKGKKEAGRPQKGK
jgi:hypothetical protein